VAGMPHVDAAPHGARARSDYARGLACRAQPARCAQVFDDWKAFASRAAAGAGDDGEAMPEPRLSNVTLAFLEACCREQVRARAPFTGVGRWVGWGWDRVGSWTGAGACASALSCAPCWVACWCCAFCGFCCGCARQLEAGACKRACMLRTQRSLRMLAQPALT